MDERVQVTVECCGVASRIAGAEHLAVVLPEAATVLDLFEVLAERSTEMAELLARCACARGDAIVPRGTQLADGDELALLPPVAGG
ncbi:MAG: MoaD/ThiS family protein [Pseudomonadota bacterium]